VETDHREKKRKKTLLVFLAVLILLGLIPFLRKQTSELPVYLKASERMLAGQEIYRPSEPKPFTYPPFFGLPFVPLAILPKQLQRPLWYFLNVGLLLWILWVLQSLLASWGQNSSSGTKASHWPPWSIWLFVALLAGRHVSSVFENQSHDLLVLGLLVLGLRFLRGASDGGAGFSIGSAAACKATPLLFAPMFFWQGRFRAFLAMALTVLLATLLPDLLTPREDGRFWVQVWASTFLAGLTPGGAAESKGAWTAWNYLNQSLGGTIYRLFTNVDGSGDPHVFNVAVLQLPRSALKFLGMGLNLLLLVIVYFVTRRKQAERADPGLVSLPRHLGEFALLACAMVLLSPMSSKSHFCVLLLPAVFCAGSLWFRRWDPVVLGLCVLAMILGSLTSKGLVGSHLGNEFLARGSVTFCTLCLFFATAHVLHRWKIDRPN
jgi:hypothetical protein